MEEAGEARLEMLSRHQKEITELRSRELELKKAAAKGSKAEQRAKKKAIEEEISALDAAMKERHASELASLGFASSEDGDGGRLDGLVRAIAGVGISSAAAPAKSSKAKKWRDRRALQESEREQRIQAEQSQVVSERRAEEDALASKLQPLGLALKEIKPDGHCLYRAVEDQLKLHPASAQRSFQELRSLAASYIRDHAQDFTPFIGSEVEVEDYCREIETTAAWGGQLELEALSHALQKHIFVFSADMASIEMGGKFQRETNPSIRLSYHKHAFGLGEHYNSVVPA